jgi:predicted lipoprotein with Yx(FWY)xxD motif
MKVRQFAVMVVAVLALAACAGSEEAGGSGDTTSEAAPVASEPAPAESEPATVASETSETSEAAGAEAEAISVESSDLGDILVDGEGKTLYVFDNDTDENSTCYDDCEANWPPLTEEVEAGEGVDASLLSTSEREDGSAQVTYAGRPLYYFAADQAPGDTNGQGIGDVWWVVGPDGEAIEGAAGGEATAGAAGGGEDDGSGY